jgi:hypothetical protein
MSFIWDTLIDCKEQIIAEFDKRGEEIQEEGIESIQSTRQWLD